MNLHLLLEKLHGHVALLGIALCFHAPISLRRVRSAGRRARIAAYCATVFMVAGTALGWVVYPEYRREVRQMLYVTSPALGRAFETKEHIGTFALALVLAGAVVTWQASRPGLGPALTPAIRTLYLWAGVLASVSAVVGVYLASVYGFAYGAGK